MPQASNRPPADAIRASNTSLLHPAGLPACIPFTTNADAIYINHQSNRRAAFVLPAAFYGATLQPTGLDLFHTSTNGPDTSRARTEAQDFTISW